jgi:hypothetical protein
VTFDFSCKRRKRMMLLEKKLLVGMFVPKRGAVITE